MKITSIESPPEGCDLWSGMAIKDGVRLQWFLESDGCFNVREEDLGCRHIDENGDQWFCFMNILGYRPPKSPAREHYFSYRVFMPSICRAAMREALFRQNVRARIPSPVPPLASVAQTTLSSLLNISNGTKSRFPRDALDGNDCMRKRDARQADQSGEHHGRSLSRCRRCRRKRPSRDGAGHRVYVKGRLSWRPLSF
jgi:hypothetical protein